MKGHNITPCKCLDAHVCGKTEEYENWPKPNPQRNAVFEKAETKTFFQCSGCEYSATYGTNYDRSQATNAAYVRGWRVIGKDLLCNQCAEQRNWKVRSELI